MFRGEFPLPSSYPGRHMPLPKLEPGTSGKKWVSVANWATPVGCLPSYLVRFITKWFKLYK
ncbi:hypothetical protein Hanom_Chr16g01462761 [Helianthus anomalus]